MTKRELLNMIEKYNDNEELVFIGTWRDNEVMENIHRVMSAERIVRIDGQFGSYYKEKEA